MRATPKLLALTGVALLVLAVLCGLGAVAVRVAADDAGGSNPLVAALTVATQVGILGSVLLLVAAGSAWVIRVGVRSARDD